MSGVYIKGVKLPTIREGQMVIRIEPSGKADVQWSGMVGGEYTKAVELPDHGDLIDKDKFYIDLMDRGVDQVQTDDYTEICQAVYNAPVIIPAERSEDGKVHSSK